MKVRLLYRNYKPLHKVYESLINDPPEGIDYIVPPVNASLKKYYKFYKTLRFFPPTRALVKIVEQLYFAKANDDSADVYHYINMISETKPDKPYIVDTEHAAGLISFSPDKKRIKKVEGFLSDPDCHAIVCWSFAAKCSLRELLGKDFGLIADKVHVIYPAIRRPKLPKPDHSLIKDSNRLKILYVGNQVYLKGLDELLFAIKAINREHGADKLELHVVADEAASLVQKYELENLHMYPPTFTRDTIISKLYLPADVFIMPTKEDTFGLALLDAQVCGTPVITTSQFAARELVRDGIDGVLLRLDKPILDTITVPDKKAMDSVLKPNFDNGLSDQIYKALEDILSGRVDLKQMGRNAIDKFDDGQKFSVGTRNAKLLKVYRRILKP